MGASAAGGVDALLGRETLAGLAANDNGNGLQNRRLEFGMGYGFSAVGDRFTSTPELGIALANGYREYSLGWRLDRAGNGLNSLSFGLETARREHVGDIADLEHTITFRLGMRF